MDALAADTTREQIVKEYAADIPMRRVGRPEEIAAAVALLADPRVSALVGPDPDGRWDGHQVHLTGWSRPSFGSSIP